MGDKPFTYDFSSNVYQAFIERTSRLGSEEIREHYDGNKNYATAFQTFEGITSRSYLNGALNELLFVKSKFF